ncbi:hypothetical protein [Thermococcus thioreducens]|uniref:Uncharacterized protein n=1 Tax=Thermococcus thioreducens TaxID=277988 RepID=A0A0Q2S2G6_9EURY|nr:hypothetical protein [Thermococcus thioreducens]ASJ11898.1 hypothetical protein A3L14_02905 [Thermococcus thioreducens]KQH81691.1 hypothetical protein AMR53_09865 [Thermococcus thioreducens]
MEEYATFTFPEISYLKKTIMKTLMLSKHRPDFIIVETKNVGDKELLILTGYKRHRNNKIEVIFKQSKEIAVKKGYKVTGDE